MNSAMNCAVSVSEAASGSFGADHDLGPLKMLLVRGDQMEPRLRGWRDYVLYAPCNRYLYETEYAIDLGDPWPLVYSVRPASTGELRIFRANPRYPNHHDGDIVQREWFNDHVVGIIVCEMKVRDEDLIRKAWEARK